MSKSLFIKVNAELILQNIEIHSDNYIIYSSINIDNVKKIVF